MNTAWMQSPDGKEVREIPENELTPWMVQGWKQVPAPAPAPPLNTEEE